MIKDLIEEQKCKDLCDPFKRKQRQCKIDQLLRMMLTAQRYTNCLSEVYSQMKELYVELGCEEEDVSSSSSDLSKSDSE